MGCLFGLGLHLRVSCAPRVQLSGTVRFFESRVKVSSILIDICDTATVVRAHRQLNHHLFTDFSCNLESNNALINCQQSHGSVTISC